MNPKKIQTKIFTRSIVDLTEIIPIFHRWIQDDQLDGLIIDVADYRHVPNGPGVLLIGHEGDYALDLANGRPSISYKHKREWPEGVSSLTQKLVFAVEKAKTAAELLAQQTDIQFDFSEIEIRFPDRLSIPNSAESFADILSILAADSNLIFGISGAEFSYQSLDPRQALTIAVRNLPTPIPA